MNKRDLLVRFADQTNLAPGKYRRLPSNTSLQMQYRPLEIPRQPANHISQNPPTDTPAWEPEIEAPASMQLALRDGSRSAPARCIPSQLRAEASARGGGTTRETRQVRCDSTWRSEASTQPQAGSLHHSARRPHHLSPLHSAPVAQRRGSGFKPRSVSAQIRPGAFHLNARVAQLSRGADFKPRTVRVQIPPRARFHQGSRSPTWKRHGVENAASAGSNPSATTQRAMAL